MEQSEPHPGAIRSVYQQRLKEIRGTRGWTQKRLAEEMGRIGYPMDRATIAKIETGKRPLEVSELVAFAYALGVEPASLFMPRGGEAEDIALTKNVTVKAPAAVAWAHGLTPLRPGDVRTFVIESPSFDAGRQIVVEIADAVSVDDTASPQKEADDAN